LRLDIKVKKIFIFFKKFYKVKVKKITTKNYINYFSFLFNDHTARFAYNPVSKLIDE